MITPVFGVTSGVLLTARFMARRNLFVTASTEVRAPNNSPEFEATRLFVSLTDFDEPTL
jgi:hypothetical protein